MLVSSGKQFISKLNEVVYSNNLDKMDIIVEKI